MPETRNTYTTGSSVLLLIVIVLLAMLWAFL